MMCSNGETMVGPKRVLPGRLSVSRTFGDPEAKVAGMGGKPGVIVAVPEVKSFKITDKFDYVVLASDGIYDKLSNKDVVQCVANAAAELGHTSVHDVCAAAVECVAKNALMRKSLDNVTVVMFAFRHFKHYVKQKLGMSQTYSATHKEELGCRAVITPTAKRSGERGRTPDLNAVLRNSLK